MVKKLAKSKAPRKNSMRAYRKVTYSLPESVASELDRRNARSEHGKSRMVAEALAFYFAEQDKKALGVLYAEAASDPQFLADNEAVQEDFASLDREADAPSR